MTKRERVLAALRGDEVDRPPVGFWGHDFIREWSAEGLAAAMLQSVREFDYDYLKVNPRATYYAEAWGCRYTPSGDPARGPETEHFFLHEPADLERVQQLDGTSGPWAEQLTALGMIGDGLKGEVPFVQTVFSPLSVLGRLADGRDRVLRWMADAPAPLHGALAAITETLASYARAVVNRGADGIFLPTTEWGTYDVLSDEQFATFSRPYDLRVLAAVGGAPFNILHVCRPNNMLQPLADYPVSAVNWADRASGNASLADAKAGLRQAVMGGVDERQTLLRGSPADVRAQVADAIGQTGGRGVLIAPGCSISPQTPPGNIRAAVDAVRSRP
jgi:uroporphyrinogen decarboxylase